MNMRNTIKAYIMRMKKRKKKSIRTNHQVVLLCIFRRDAENIHSMSRNTFVVKK